MTFQEKRFHISGGNLLFLRWNFIFPPLEILFSTVGNSGLLWFPENG